MKKIILFLIYLASSFMFAQEIARIEFNTGDDEIDTHLNDINVYASANYDAFKNDLKVKFGAAIEEVDRYIVKEKVPPADVYYGYCLCTISSTSFKTVMKMRSDKNGWGSIAKDLGIKPGSKEFHALKNSAISKIDKDKMKKVKKDKSNKKNKTGNKSKLN